MRSLKYEGTPYRNDRAIIPYYDFSGGIFDTINTDRLNDDEVCHLDNFDIKTDGSLKMRDNFVLSSISPDIPNVTKSYTGVGVYDKGASYEIIGLLDKDIVKIPENTVLVANFGEKLASVQYGGKYYLLGNDKLYIYDGVVCEPIATYYSTEISQLTQDEQASNDLDYVKKGTMLTVIQGRLIISGIPGEPNSVYMSEPLKTYFFDSRDLKDVLYPVQTDNDRVTALTEYADGLLIFKRESIYVITGVLGGTDTQMYRINAPTGTMSPGTIARVDNFLLFLGTDRRMYAMHSIDKYRINIYNIGDKVSGKLAEIGTTSRETIQGIYYDGKYMLVYDNKCLNLYILDNSSSRLIENPSWSTYSGLDIKGFIHIPGQDIMMYSNNSTRTYIFADRVGDYDIEGGTEDLIPYKATVKFKSYNLSIPEHYKNFRAGWIQFDKVDKIDIQTFKHNVFIDNRKIYLSPHENKGIEQFNEEEVNWSIDQEEVLWDDFYWAGTNNAAYYFRVNAKGRTIQNELEISTYGHKMSILGTSFEAKVKQPQRNKFNTNFKRGN